PADVIHAMGQVAVGIGFLCGGVIVRDGTDVHGLNTAATLWCIGAIGSLVGARYAAVATIATFALILINSLLHLVEHRISGLRLPGPRGNDD
ncbi:MAG: MgtC/SapB family protein, partial [Alphaproteobacteria bacterium]